MNIISYVVFILFLVQLFTVKILSLCLYNHSKTLPNTVFNSHIVLHTHNYVCRLVHC